MLRLLVGQRLTAAEGAGLLEREAVLASVETLLDRAATGEPATLVVRGTAGSGKSSVLDVAAAVAGRSGLRVVRARSLGIETGVAYATLAQLLSPLVDELADEARSALLDGPVGEALAALATPRTPDPDMAYGTHVAVAAFLADRARDRPLLLVLDDLQWADQATLRALAPILVRLQEHAVGVLLAARTDVPAGTAAELETLTVDARVDEVVLPPLSESGTAAVLAAAIGRAPDARTVGACHQVTGGVPFYVAAVGAELAEKVDVDVGMAAGDVPLPVAVRRSVALRLGGTGADTTAVARALAVLDDGAPSRRLADCAGLSAEATAAALRRLEELHLVTVAPDLTVAFTHSIVAGAVRADLGPLGLAEGHARAVAVLRRDGERDDRVAGHLLRLPPTADALAARTLAAAGADALGRGAFEDATRLLERALAEPPAPGERAGVLVTLGAARLLAGIAARAVEALREALATVEDPSEAGPAGVLLVTALNMSGGHREAATVVERLGAAGLPEPLRLELDAHVALTARSDVEVTPFALEVVARLRGVPEPAALTCVAVAMNEVAMLGPGEDPVTTAVELAERALAHPVALTAPQTLVGHLAVLAIALGERHDAAHRALARYEQLVADGGSRTGQMAVALLRTRIALGEGDIDAVRTHGQFTVELGTALHWHVGITLAAGWLAHAELEAGEPQQAAATLAGPAASAMEPGSGQLLVPRIVAARLRAQDGDHEGAVAELLRVGERAERWAWRNVAEMPWRSEAALSLHALGRVEEALALVDEEIAIARRAGLRGALGRALLRRSRVNGDARDRAEAIAVLRDGGSRAELARALADEGAARLGDDMDAARRALRESLDIAASIGAGATADRARRLLVATGARPRRSATTGVDALTARERTVAELAAEGLSNRAIAEREFCTVGTVEVHLTNAYRKLGVAGRRELAGVLGPD